MTGGRFTIMAIKERIASVESGIVWLL